jgi:mannosyltransferase
MGPYYALLRGWVALLGESEVALRSLSVVFAVAAVPLTFHVSERLVGRRTAVLATVLLAVNAFFIQYAQEARGYSMVVALVLAATALFVRAVTRPSWPVWGAYVGVTAIAVYTHFFAALVIVAHALSIAFLRPEDRPPRRMLVASALGIAILLAPLAVFVATTTNTRDWIAVPSLRTLVSVGAAMVGGRSGPVEIALMLVYAGVAAVGVAAIWRVWRTEGRSTASWRHALVFGWLAVPMAGAALASLVKPIFVIRYFIVALPGLLIIAAMGIREIRRGWLAGVALLALLGLSGHQVGMLYTTLDREDWRGAARHVLAHSRPGDGIVFNWPQSRRPFGYQVDRASRGGAPRPVLASFDWIGTDPTKGDEVDLQRLARAVGAYDRVWLVLARGGQTDRWVRGVLATDLHRRDVAHVPSVVIELYARDAGG